MGAVEHLKTLCCLGLKPESAMISVTPLLHEIIPHGAAPTMLFKPDARTYTAYTENPETTPIWLANAWRFVNDPTSPMYSYLARFRAVSIGWTLHLQGRTWLDCGWYREVEAPTDSCWILDAMIGDTGRTIAGTHLTRPRSARPFTVDDVQRLDRLRPWLAHAFRPRQTGGIRQEDCDLMGTAGAPVLSGQIILTAATEIVFQTPGVEALLRIIEGGSTDLTCYIPVRDKLPVPIQKLLKRLNSAVNGDSSSPPRMQVSTPYGIVTLDAKWIVPAGTQPADIAKDPKSCLIAVTFELREHALAHAARVLRESGATPSQLRVGIQLALGKSKPAIADDLGVKLTTVTDLTRKLYQTLDVHNAAEMGAKTWLAQPQPLYH
jgi:hypothetical protein